LIDPITWYFQMADKIAEKIIVVFKLTRRFGVAGMKAALDLFGYYGGPNRSPMPSVSADARQVITIAFIDNEFVPQLR
jgi:hypothetical protein